MASNMPRHYFTLRFMTPFIHRQLLNGSNQRNCIQKIAKRPIVFWTTIAFRVKRKALDNGNTHAYWSNRKRTLVEQYVHQRV